LRAGGSVFENPTPRSPSAHAPLNRGAASGALIFRFILLFAFLVPLLALAAEIPPLKARITDTTGTLNAQQREALEQTLAEFEKRKGTQIAVLMVPTTEPETIEQYAVRVEEAWKLGRKGIDDSALLVVAKNDRRLHIEVGYGLEGALPDAIAKRIIDNDIVPRFKAGDFYGGIRAGVDRIMRVAEGETLPPPAAHGPASKGFDPGLLIFVFFFLLVAGSVLRAIFGRALGAGVAGGIAGFVVWMMVGSLIIALAIAAIEFFVMLSTGAFGGGSRRRGWGSPYGGWGGGGFGGGGFGGGGFGGGGFGGGGFSGGGGGSGGGGASGSW
jgi:uncharacterized protein